MALVFIFASLVLLWAEWRLFRNVPMLCWLSFRKENRFLRNNDITRIPPGDKTIRKWRRGDSWKPIASIVFLEVISQVWVIMMWSEFNNRFRQTLQNPYDELRANFEFHALTYIKYCIILRLSAYKFQELCCLDALDELWGHTILRSRGQKVCDDILDQLTHCIIQYG
jgi:hypothetical protein